MCSALQAIRMTSCGPDMTGNLRRMACLPLVPAGGRNENGGVAGCLRKVLEKMLSPSLFGSDIERRAREVRAFPEPWQGRHERIPRHGRQRGRFRTALGARLIAWGESLTCELSDVAIGRFDGQPS